MKDAVADRRKVRSALGAAVVALVAPVAATSPAAAQFGLVESLFERVTDISFYASRGALAPRPAAVRAAHGLKGFGVELLFQVGAATRRVAPPPDTLVLRLKERRVTHSGARADTVDTYDIAEPADTGLEEVWTFELALGYGQLTGFELADRTVELHGSVRELPAVTLYASHVASGAYAGVRTGLIQTHALRLYDADGASHQGSAEAFELGGALGWTRELAGVFPFLEAAWTARSFPSVEWDTDVLPAAAPRELRLSGWSVSAGVQVPLR